MAERIVHGKPDARWGWLMIALGLYPLAIACGLFDLPDDASNAPAWVIAGCGIVFVAAGAMILGHPRSGANDLLAALISLVFAATAAWVSFFAPSEGFSGGVPFASREFNVRLARIMFGLGSVICLGVAIYAVHRFRHASRPA